MKNALVVVIAALAATACSSGPATTEKKLVDVTPPQVALVGGQPSFTLERPKSSDTTKPHFLSAQILPGRGMTTYQIRAYVPGKGEIDLMEAPPLAEAPKLMDGGPDDLIGNKSFSVGGAILLPFANRIRGKLSSDGSTIETPIMGKPVKLIANWKGKKPEAVKNAMHGLMLDAKMDSVTTDKTADESSVTGTLHAGDFQGHWLSKTDVNTKITLKDDAFLMTVTAKNVGADPLPMGIGWHPYFVLPSGDRTQAKLHLPAKQRALVTNYDDVFPTGKVEKVAGTPYDFTAPGGAALKDLFLDDSFVDLQKTPEGNTVIEIRDPASKFGLRVTGMSKEITAIQVYAPLDKKFVVVEPQFNWVDPYSNVWAGKKTGMVVLKPGETVSYSVKVEFITE
ncbi:MAG: aldose 1-epimerase [Bryobacteraceae bacterium]